MESSNNSAERSFAGSVKNVAKSAIVLLDATKRAFSNARESLSISGRKLTKAIPLLITSASIAALIALGGSPAQAEDQIGGAVATPAGGWIPTPTRTPTRTSTPKPTATEKPANTPTPKPTATEKPANTPTPKPTATEKPADTPTPKPTATEKPTETPTPKPTEKPTVTPIATIIATLEKTPTLVATITKQPATVTPVSTREIRPTVTKKKPTATSKPKPTATLERKPTPKIVKTIINSKILVLPRTGGDSEELTFFERQMLKGVAVRFITEARFKKDNWENQEELAVFRDTYDTLTEDIEQNSENGTMCTNDAVVGKRADSEEKVEFLPAEENTQAEKPLLSPLELTLAAASLALLSGLLLGNEYFKGRKNKNKKNRS